MKVGDPPVRDGMRVLKVGAGSRTEVIITGESVVWIGQHWMRRPQMCLSEDCPACRWNRPRTIGFMSVQTRDGRGSLLEISVGAYERLIGLMGLDGERGRKVDALGLVCSVSRRGRKTPLVLEPTDERVMVPYVSSDRIIRVIALLYGWPRPADGELIDAYQARGAEAMRPVLEAAVEAERYLAARQ